jgi:hypothetical protein
MISGAHFILFSAKAESDREFFKSVLGLSHVDVGGGWLIFALPPSELAVHPAAVSGSHELFLMCKDLRGTIKKLRQKKVKCTTPSEQEWGKVSLITLPGGGQIHLYPPKHRLARL